MFAAIWTRPPVCYGFSLSDCWAWFRYFAALSANSELRLREEWTSLDPHQKTVLSADFGVGFVTLLLNETLDMVRFADTLWVVNTAKPGRFKLGSEPTKRGPAKSPDYIAEDSLGRYSVVECKGTQSSRRALRDAIKRGTTQKKNLHTTGVKLQHTLVAGLFVPQWQSSERPVILIADPDPPEIWRELSTLSQDQIARGVSQVSYAKELAILGLSQTASTLVRAQESHESVWVALSRDLDTPYEGRAIGDEVRLRREYTLPVPARIWDGMLLKGVRFDAELPESAVSSLRLNQSPEAFGEAQRDAAAQNQWERNFQDGRALMRSPFGTKLAVELLVD